MSDKTDKSSDVLDKKEKKVVKTNKLNENPEEFKETATKDRIVKNTAGNEYALRGTQVEPKASFWFRCQTLSSVTKKEVLKYIGTIYPYPYPGSNTEKKELQEIRDLQAVAESKTYFDSKYRSKLSDFLINSRYIKPHPAGAVINRRANLAQRLPGTPIIKNGLELATLFEDETPGLWHRHVFNIFLDTPIKTGAKVLFRQFLSPPRQALYWHALDLAIDSALQAVWHYKWLADKHPQIARRRRPYEADKKPIIYDFRVDFDATGNIIRKDLKPPLPSPEIPAQPSPGTPRHPAYASGHSTYSAAASRVLGCLLGAYLPDFKIEFTKLAENIGEARIWGGVHWRTDHEFGRQIGETVGDIVINQLNQSGILASSPVVVDPPSRQDLAEQAKEFERNCGEGDEDFCAKQMVDAKNAQGRQG